MKRVDVLICFASTFFIGSCLSPIVGADCEEGKVVCNGVCVDLQTDEFNCGACGNVCDQAEVCSYGVCHEPDDCMEIDGCSHFDAGWRPDGRFQTDAQSWDGGFVSEDAGSFPEFDAGGTSSDATPAQDAGMADDGGSNPGDVDGGSPGDVDGGSNPGDVDGGSNPGDVDGGSNPGDVDGGSNPGDVDAGSNPGDVDGGNGSDVDAGGGGGGPTGCDIGEINCDHECVNPETDHENCGGCGIRCESFEYCASQACVPVCEAPLELCGDLCVDFSSDPDHCGGCGIQCDSGICEEGVCLGLMPGHVILIGHNYTHPRDGMNRLLGNSVFSLLGTDIKVLAFDNFASDAAVAGADAAIHQVALERGRHWTKIPVHNADDITIGLKSARVLMIYAPTAASSNNASVWQLGLDLKTALDRFTKGGGVVIVLDGGGPTDGNQQILEAAELFEATSRVDVTGQEMSVVSPADFAAQNVPITYAGEISSVGYDTDWSNVVVRSTDGHAVVVHSTVF